MRDLAESVLFLPAIPDAPSSRKAEREPLRLMPGEEDGGRLRASAVEPRRPPADAPVPPELADRVDVVVVARGLSRLVTISSRKSRTDCASSGLVVSPALPFEALPVPLAPAVVLAAPAPAPPRAPAPFLDEAPVELDGAGSAPPSKESRLSRNCMTSSRCDLVGTREGVDGRDMALTSCK